MNRAAVTLAVIAFGAFAPVASAHAHPRSYSRTYPVASRLCARVAAGHTPRRLAGDTSAINTACGTLSNSYQQALSTYQAAVAPIAADVSSTLQTLVAARQAAVQSRDWSAYAAAVQQTLSTFRSLRAQERSAARAYVTAIRAARRTFWSTVHSLAGAASLPADSGTPTPPPAPTVPVVA